MPETDTRPPRFLSLSASGALRSLLLVLLFGAGTCLLVIRLLVDNISNISSNRLRADFEQFNQLQKSAYATQLSFIETLPLISAGGTAQAFRLQLERDWPSLSLLNDVASLAIYKADGTPLVILGHGTVPFNISRAQLQQVQHNFMPQQQLFCDSECHFYVLAPIMLQDASQYIAITSIPAELVAYELSWLSGVDVTLVDKNLEVITSSVEHTNLNAILNQLHTGKRQTKSFIRRLLDRDRYNHIANADGQRYPRHSIAHQDHYYSFALFPIDTLSENNHYRALLARDITPEARRATQLIIKTGLLLLLGALLFTLLNIATQRGLTRKIRILSQALPNLAKGHFDKVHAQLGVAIDRPRFINELDQLEDTTRTLTNQLDSITGELEKQRQHLHTMAYQDSLTGLPNRQSFYDQLVREINVLSRSNTALGLLFIDLDYFKEINDTYGHNVGDRILCGLATRTNECIRKTDRLFRLGGDEFVIIVTHLQSVEGLQVTAKKVLQAFEVPLKTSGQSFTLSLSIGGTLTRDDDTSVDQLLHLADEAMYASKHQGRGCYTFHGDLKQSAEG